MFTNVYLLRKGNKDVTKVSNVMIIVIAHIMNVAEDRFLNSYKESSGESERGCYQKVRLYKFVHDIGERKKFSKGLKRAL